VKAFSLLCISVIMFHGRYNSSPWERFGKVMHVPDIAHSYTLSINHEIGDIADAICTIPQLVAVVQNLIWYSPGLAGKVVLSRSSK